MMGKSRVLDDEIKKISCYRWGKKENRLVKSWSNQEKGKSLKDWLLIVKMPSSPTVSLSVEDIVNAENAISCYEQRQYLLEKGKQCNRGSSLYKLDPFMDFHGFWILRVVGRTGKMAMTIEVKHPMILPKHFHISKLILSHIHQQVGHSGRGHMLSISSAVLAVWL